MTDTTTFDRSTLGEKTRVYTLAKALGMSSRELLAAMAEVGVIKVAQSALSRTEAEVVLDFLLPKQQPAAEEQPATEQQPDTKEEPAAEEQPAQFSDEEKLRYQVEKNVENEINQIERKVERELVGASDEAAVDVDSDKLRHKVGKNVENEIHQIEEKVQRDIDDRLDKGMLAAKQQPAKPTTPISPEETAAVTSVAPQEESPQASPAFNLNMPLFRAPTPTTEDDRSYELAYEEDRVEEHPRNRRRGRRGAGRGSKRDVYESEQEQPELVEEEQELEAISEPLALKGSTRLEAQRRRRVEMREESRKKRHIISEAEFLARRESVKRTMVVRERQRHDGSGMVTQVGVLEDDLLVEHFVTSDTQSSMVGNIYLGRVQNVLPSMEAAFIDIGKGRNGVLYAGEVDWRAAGLGGRSRKIEEALKSGDQVLVQVAKDPAGNKGARLTTQISLAGRYLVYVPGGKSAGISRKLPAPERKRLKSILRDVVPSDGGVIIRTAAEGVSEEAIASDVQRLHNVWLQIEQRTKKEKSSKGAKPVTMYEEPNMLVKVVRDLFNEDFSELVVDGKRAWNTVNAYIQSMAPDLSDRLVRFDRDEHGDADAFENYRIDEQLQKALSRKVWLPSGGTLVIDRTEAMTVIDVNTGKFTGAGGNLEETVTRNNLEAAEEIVRQMRLRDLGGMIVVDFIDMVLPENRDLVLRRLTEVLSRDRTRHQISEVTSLGLVQMTRKRLGAGLLETFATECEECAGRGVIIHDDPVEQRTVPNGRGKHGVLHRDPKQHPVVVAMSNDTVEPKDDSAPTIEELASAVVMEREDDSKHQQAELEASSASYEEALAAFEASPRRKRDTRGNSVSDFPPKLEDFLDHKMETVEEESVAFRRSSRSRRRAVRRNSAASFEHVVELPETSEVPVAAYRRRRRAVRKTLQPHEDSGAQHLADQQTEAESESEHVVAAHRNRRRAVWRSTWK